MVGGGEEQQKRKLFLEGAHLVTGGETEWREKRKIFFGRVAEKEQEENI